MPAMKNGIVNTDNILEQHKMIGIIKDCGLPAKYKKDMLQKFHLKVEVKKPSDVKAKPPTDGGWQKFDFKFMNRRCVS